MAKVSFKQVMDRLRPSLQGQQNLGMFTAQIVDMGIGARGGKGGERSATDIVKPTTWRLYANGTRPISVKVASEIVGRWDCFDFRENLAGAYGEDVLNSLSDSLREIDMRINKGNVGDELGALLYRIFSQITGVEESSSSNIPTVIQKAESVGTPYFNKETNRICIGDDFVATPYKIAEIPDEIQMKELRYVEALLCAYCEQCDLQGVKPQLDDIPNRYREHFTTQRKAFFSAEWLKDTSWNCIDDGKSAFQQFLEEIWQGVQEANLDDYPTQIKRMFATLQQSTSVQLNSMALDRIEGLIDVWCRKGACHELVSEGKLSWEG